MDDGLDETTVRDSVLQTWRHGDATPGHDGVGRCLRLAAGIGTGLGLMGVCLVVAVALLPPMFVVMPLVAALVALAIAVNLGVGDSAAPAPPAEVGRAPALLEFTRASR